MMQRILRLADSAEVSAKVQKNGLHGTGSGIDSEQQWFHIVLSSAALTGRVEWRDGDHPKSGHKEEEHEHQQPVHLRSSSGELAPNKDAP